MHHDYHDIRSRIPFPPVWFDEHAVPRYCGFTPDVLADIYADEAVLFEIACQSCGEPFVVAMSRNQRMEQIRILLAGGARAAAPPSLAEEITSGMLHYGDPPNVGCCSAGATMNCEDLRVLEYWRRHDPQFVSDGVVTDNRYFRWTRYPEFERSLGE